MNASNCPQNPRNEIESIKWVAGSVHLHFVSAMMNQRTKSRDDSIHVHDVGPRGAGLVRITEVHRIEPRPKLTCLSQSLLSWSTHEGMSASSVVTGQQSRWRCQDGSEGWCDQQCRL